MDTGETCPLIKKPKAAVPENRRKNGVYLFLPGFLAAQHLYRREWQNLALCHGSRKTLRMDSSSPQARREMGADCKYVHGLDLLRSLT